VSGSGRPRRRGRQLGIQPLDETLDGPARDADTTPDPEYGKGKGPRLQRPVQRGSGLAEQHRRFFNTEQRSWRLGEGLVAHGSPVLFRARPCAVVATHPPNERHPQRHPRQRTLLNPQGDIGNHSVPNVTLAHARSSCRGWEEENERGWNGVTLTRCFSWAGVTLRVGESARGRTEIAGFSRCVLITREHGG